MFRWLIPFRRNSRGALKELDALQKIRKYPIFLGLSSGILYHGYMSQNKHTSISLCSNRSKQKEIIHPLYEDLVLLFSDLNSQLPNKLPNDAKMDRLLKINQDIEDDLPLFFEKSLFNEVPKNLLDPDTVVYYETKNGSVHRLRGESWIRALIVACRAYFSMRSYVRRLELTSILSDTEKWEVEVCFRIVLLPPPSKEESHLPSDKLLERLEQRAQWRNFRATFYLSDSGKINAVKLTQLLPPFKDSAALYPLNKLALWKTLGPNLPGRRRLPTPTPYVIRELSSQCVTDINNNQNGGAVLWILENVRNWPFKVSKIVEPFDITISSLPEDKVNSSFVKILKHNLCTCRLNKHQIACDHIAYFLQSVSIPCESISLNSSLLEFYVNHFPSTRDNGQIATNKQILVNSQMRSVSYSSDNSAKSVSTTSVGQHNLSHCFPSSDDLSPVFLLPKLYL
ncbi:hypothetical protein MN116_007066 [Schistosoma mekongi]|uniref:SWIM-type domain-containing protein n=1 Tax=Schistosoma mekongi TaxID=38744 RepID=A0AAE1Z9U0_SCHME|nr:hypothetical protein MN116_007066 [Schistosoma mekongi]